MGSFGGHAVPGTFFFFVGLWHVVQVFNRYFYCHRTHQEFVSSTWYPCKCQCCCGKTKNFAWESCVKMVLALIGMTIEISSASYGSGIFNDPGNEQHVTMYLSFGINGLLEVLTYYGLTFSPYVNHVSYVFAFFVEYILFHFHLHGREDIDVLVHTLLLYVILVSIFCVIYMMRYPNNVMAALVDGYLLLIQGTWFWQIGFILYNPLPNAVKWDSEDHGNMMLTACYFSWHCGIVLLFVVFIGSLFARCNKTPYQLDVEGEDKVALLKVTSSNDGYDKLNCGAVSGEDVKFSDEES